MNLIYVTLICAILHVGYQTPLKSWTLQPNILVLEVNGKVGQQALKCLHSADGAMNGNDKDILWKKNGEDEAQRGNSYQVYLEESLGGGNYSCHSTNGSLLNHTVVLIKEDITEKKKILVKSDLGDYLKCSTQNFEGAFQCSWTWHRTRVGKVALIRVGRETYGECSVDSSGHHWSCSSDNINCSVDATGDGISCKDKRHCAFAEEKKRISFKVYVRTKGFLVEDYSKHFYLSEIVKPDKVTISRLNTTMIELTYPGSWSSPYSYFPLIFQVSQSRHTCENCKNPCDDSTSAETVMVNSSNTCQVEVKKKWTVCVRAKDAFCNSQWGEWNHLRLRKKGKRNQRKHTS
ncbi:interleukin 12Ba [Corythoichthys intestinalis]|uniref:interleukin 12Ba n=1 Tax=Corythoichthys intestinalis TaxID=161448 RepID=UPI0025A5340D|nr:interleukin 12Ba [Corythoichthys intestinalis]XP_061793254.1 interleukin-12 subunit beta-like [Nerophis lumbriciformis]